MYKFTLTTIQVKERKGSVCVFTFFVFKKIKEEKKSTRWTHFVTVKVNTTKSKTSRILHTFEIFKTNSIYINLSLFL